MNLSEQRQRAFKQLKPKYQRLFRFYIFLYAVAIVVALCGLNLALANFIGIQPNSPVQDQPVGEVWFVIFMLQFVVLVPAALVKSRNLLAWFFSKREGWSDEQTKQVSSGIGYPPHWCSTHASAP